MAGEEEVSCISVTDEWFFPGAVALSGAYYGQGSGPIFLDNADCSLENDSTLLQCFVGDVVGVHNCVHAEDASVICPGRENVLGHDVCLCSVSFPYHQHQWFGNETTMFPDHPHPHQGAGNETSLLYR